MAGSIRITIRFYFSGSVDRPTLDRLVFGVLDITLFRNTPLEDTGFSMGEIDLRIESLNSEAKTEPLDTLPDPLPQVVSQPGDLWLFINQADRRGETWISPSIVTKNHHLIDTWKVLIPKAGTGNSGGHVIPDMVLSRPLMMM